jgi:hypothetical protein
MKTIALIKTLFLLTVFIFGGADSRVFSNVPEQVQVTQEAAHNQQVEKGATAVLVDPQPQQNTLLENIAAQNLQSLPRAADNSTADAIKDSYAFYNFLTETITNPQLHNKRKRAFKIIASAEKGNNAAWMNQSVLDKTTNQDLNLLYGSKENPATHLASILSEGRTHTELGKAYLCGLIARPTAYIQLLEARQQVIRTLVENEALFNELDALLKEMAVHESLFTGLWDTEQIMQFVEQNYSKMDGFGDSINRSSFCLELQSLLGISAMCMAAGIMTISPAVLTVDGISILYQGQPVSKLTDTCFGSLGVIFKVFPALENRWIKGTLTLGMGALSSFMVTQLLKNMHTKFLIDDFLKNRLMHVARYKDAANGILQAITKHAPELGESCTFFKNLASFSSDQMNNDSDLVLLNDLLHSSTFEKGSEEQFELFFSRGNMLCAYYLLSIIKDKFASAMAGIGELDAFLTAAKLIKESKKDGTSWCLPSYVQEAATPSVQLAGFWSPFIDSGKAVSNSIDLGIQHRVPNIVVTGPNSAGKSTILKSIALAIILGQSLGVVPAQAMALTPFSYLTSYMNVADSIVDQESRFQAEARRIFEYGDHLEDIAKNHEFSFALFDEIFSGTSPAEGADLSYKVATIFGTYSNSISLVATHFEKLTSLEKDTAGTFINYKVAVGQNSDGSVQFSADNKIKRFFSLSRGISHQRIAREVFKEKGQTGQSNFFEKCFSR